MPSEVDLLLICLAPELDLRYEKLYAYLQDDVTKKRPTVELALNLLSPSWEAKVARRQQLNRQASHYANIICCTYTMTQRSRALRS